MVSYRVQRAGRNEYGYPLCEVVNDGISRLGAFVLNAPTGFGGSTGSVVFDDGTMLKLGAAHVEALQQGIAVTVNVAD